MKASLYNNNSKTFALYSDSSSKNAGINQNLLIDFI